MELKPVIQFVVLIVYVIIYINIWPIRKLGTTHQYKNMLFLDIVVIIIYAITKVPIEVYYVFGAITIKDLFMIWLSWWCS